MSSMLGCVQPSPGVDGARASGREFRAVKPFRSRPWAGEAVGGRRSSIPEDRTDNTGPLIPPSSPICVHRWNLWTGKRFSVIGFRLSGTGGQDSRRFACFAGHSVFLPASPPLLPSVCIGVHLWTKLFLTGWWSDSRAEESVHRFTQIHTDEEQAGTSGQSAEGSRQTASTDYTDCADKTKRIAGV